MHIKQRRTHYLPTFWKVLTAHALPSLKLHHPAQENESFEEYIARTVPEGETKIGISMTSLDVLVCFKKEIAEWREERKADRSILAEMELRRYQIALCNYKLEVVKFGIEKAGFSKIATTSGPSNDQAHSAKRLVEQAGRIEKSMFTGHKGMNSKKNIGIPVEYEHLFRKVDLNIDECNKLAHEGLPELCTMLLRPQLANERAIWEPLIVAHKGSTVEELAAKAPKKPEWDELWT